MSAQNLSSALSDDAGRLNNRGIQRDTHNDDDSDQQRRTNVRQSNGTQNDDATLSVTAELSAADVARQERPDEDAISEQMIEEEDEHQNSPTGSINERREYDIKSEFIRPKAPKFSKASCVDPGEMSNYALQSQKTIMTAIRKIDPSPSVPLGDTSRSQMAFGKKFDQYYAQLEVKIADHYSKMRANYIHQFKLNYELNQAATAQKLVEMRQEIESQGGGIESLKHEKLKFKSCFNKFISMSASHTVLRQYLVAWKRVHAKQKQKDRIAFFSRNKMYRYRLKQVFQGWRTITHKDFKERMLADTGEFRAKLEGRMLIQWKSRVDAQMLYMAQLEEKIKAENVQQDELAMTYERSLNQGAGTMGRETTELAENPLVREISLVIAKQLINKAPSQAQGHNMSTGVGYGGRVSAGNDEDSSFYGNGASNNSVEHGGSVVESSTERPGISINSV